MEVVHHCYKASKVSPQEGEGDVISSMPENVIVNIIDRLPLKEAVATSILSPNWRFKWTLLTQLILDDNFFIGLLSRKNHFDKTIISKLLLHLKQVTNFFLITSNLFLLNDEFIYHYSKIEDEDIHHWVMLLSRIRGFKELTLENLWETPLKLPSHLFTCLDLKFLKVSCCVLSPSPEFSGFPKLLSLDFYNVSIQNHRFGELIVKCPLLETLKILNYGLRGEVKLFEIAKLENLKTLSLSSCLLDIHMTMVRLSTVFQHMSLLPKLQELYLCFNNCKFLPEDVAQNAVFTTFTFPFLKDLTLCGMDFSSVSILSCAFGMISGCRNLQNLRILAKYLQNDVPLPAIFPPEIDCKTMGQLQLQNVNLLFIKGLENEVCLIKYILACSPMLKSIEILLDATIKSKDKHKLASRLLKLQRASPIAEVIF